MGGMAPGFHYMRFSSTLPAVRATLARWASGARDTPARRAAPLLALLFGGYLYGSSSYEGLWYDAQGYWELANQFWAPGHFNFFAFESILRGYLFPLLLSPLTLVTAYWGWPPIDLTRGVGVVTATALFGVVAPGLWRALQPPGAPAVPGVRRLVFGLLGFVCWRDYFNFSLTDFPALLALLAGLWLLLRGRSVSSGLLAGLAVAAAANFRPVYAAALPLAACLSLWPQAAVGTGPPRRVLAWGRRLAFLAGIGAVLYPQLRVNQMHYGVSSPLVLTAKPEEPNLYLSQLRGGFLFQKYETNVGSDYPQPQMFFDDRAGDALLNQAELLHFDSYATYFKGILSHPLPTAALLLRHLFNGLDVQYPTPYPQQVYVKTWPLALVNYTALITGLGVLISLGWQRPKLAHGPALLVVLSILGPCAAALPAVMECRFLMPLHLLLCAAAAFSFRPRRLWQAASWAKRSAALAMYTALLVGCFAVSMQTQLQLKFNPRTLFDWQQPPPVPW